MFERDKRPSANRGWQHDPNSADPRRDESLRLDQPATDLPFVPRVYEALVAPTCSVPGVAVSDMTASESVEPEHSPADTPPPQTTVDHAVTTEVAPVSPESWAEPTLAAGSLDPDVMTQRETEQFAQGVAQGEQQARDALAQDTEALCDVLQSTGQALQELLNDPQRLFEPMKRLCLHLAEHIVLTELHISGHAIDHLIHRCLHALDSAESGLVVIELNPQDKERLQQLDAGRFQGMRLEAVSDLLPGSVRVRVNDAMVEDLVQYRLKALASALAIQTESWREHSVLLPVSPPSQDEVQDDVHHP